MENERHDAADRAEDEGAVEGHGFTGVDGVETIDAQDEGPDVEGHSFTMADTIDTID